MTERRRHARTKGAEIRTLVNLAAILTPVLILGSWLMSRVAHNEMGSNRRLGYKWELYFGIPLLSGVSMACATVDLYMLYETIFDLLHSKPEAAVDHAMALGAFVTYSCVAVKFVGIMERKAAQRRRAVNAGKLAANTERAERRKREMAALGATILDDDDDLPFTASSKDV